MFKKKGLVVFFVLAILMNATAQQQNGLENPGLNGNIIISNFGPKTSTIVLKGTGFAANSENALDDVLNVYAIFGKAGRIVCSESTENCSATNNKGFLFLDRERFMAENIVVSFSSISADIFSVENPEKSGKLSLNLIEKVGNGIWAGKLVFAEKIYNFYAAELQKKLSAVERKNNIVGQCRANPRDPECKNLNFCRNHPDDEKCGKLEENFCRQHALDIRCKAFLKETCEKNPEKEFCGIKTRNGKKIITINPGHVKAGTGKNAVTGIIKNKAGKSKKTDSTEENKITINAGNGTGINGIRAGGKEE